MARRTPFGQRLLKNMGKKWLQVIISILMLGVAITLSHRLLIKKATTEAEKKKEETEFKFMHCDKCDKEMPYNKDLANKIAMACKCKQGDAGYWTPTKNSIASGVSPYRFFYTATLVESLVWLICLYILLARKDSKQEFYYYKCIHCRDMLRYTINGFDAMVVCPSCGLFIRLPSQEEALTMDDHNDEHADLVMQHFAAKLKETGYQFPEERAAVEEAAKAGEGETTQTDPAAHSPETPR